jgi:hypothetical protein
VRQACGEVAALRVRPTQRGSLAVAAVPLAAGRHECHHDTAAFGLRQGENLPVAGQWVPPCGGVGVGQATMVRWAAASPNPAPGSPGDQPGDRCAVGLVHRWSRPRAWLKALAELDPLADAWPDEPCPPSRLPPTSGTAGPSGRPRAAWHQPVLWAPGSCPVGTPTWGYCSRRQAEPCVDVGHGPSLLKGDQRSTAGAAMGRRSGPRACGCGCGCGCITRGLLRLLRQRLSSSHVPPSRPLNRL